MPIPRNGGCPYVEIIEQPASKAVRFRYECEGRSAGCIPGVNSTTELKTYPSIKICNYRGRGVVVVSCVTKDQPHRPHPHSLVGKDTCRAGVCRMEITPDNPIVNFVSLGIQCVKKKDIADALRIREGIRVDPFRTGFEHKHEPSNVDLNSVRICFQVFIEGREGEITVPLTPIVSEPIYDKKAIADLVICKMSHCSATAAGGMEMIILCEKVAKDNVQVRFFEKRDGREVWEGYGDFKSVNVHKQVAIAFRTPSYRDRQIDEPVQVYIQLKRPTDGVTSEPLPFQFLPLDADDRDCLRRKRRKFQDNPRAELLRSVQAEAERHGILLNEPTFEYKFDPLKLEARVQSFPIGGVIPTLNNGIQQNFGTVCAPIQSPPSPLVDVPTYGDQASPSSLPSPATGYAPYNLPSVSNHQGNVNEQFKMTQNNQGYAQQQQTMNVHQLNCSQYIGYYQQQQIHRQQPPVLQKLTISQQNFPRNVNQHDIDGAVGGSDIADIVGQQQLSFDASLAQLDSAELAAFGIELSDTLSSGLSINDNTTKIENNIVAGVKTVTVGTAASWCDV